ncbi:MAG: hypothetical protein FWF84_02245 [Kiritimatiellaeota bacterium]|nr:hypothetical protein [Kiritimatiellota bacterium]
MSVQEKTTSGFTVDLIRTCFPWVFAAMFWLTVIGGTIGGVKMAHGLYVAKNMLYSSYGGSRYGGSEGGVLGAMVVGGVIGLIVSFITAVWANGVVATLLEINKNLKYLADKEKANP